MENREAVVNVDQTATYHLTLINGGDIVAMFWIGVVGVDPNWVLVSEPQVNLYEGDRTTVTISITPPRLPSSRAGLHRLAFTVTSPNHPGRMAQISATLTINPYYEFAVGDLSPKQQVISWFKRAGEVTFPIYNKGNSDAVFQVEAEDDERGCSFEFNVPGEATSRARQADMRMPPDSMVSLPITISPHSRRLVGLRKKSYSFTVTTSLPEGMQTPRSLLGQLSARPLIGPFWLILLALLLVALIVWIFNPRIRVFHVDDGKNVAIIRSGEAVTLRWNASSLANLRINPAPGPLDAPLGTATVAPTADVVYELRAENWLSRLAPSLFTDSAEVRVFVTPIPPEIRFFEVDRDAIIEGEGVNLSWQVTNADDLILEVNGLPQPLPDNAGTLSFANLAADTTFRLVASNQYREEESSQLVRVVPPTATPVPSPVVKKFLVNPPVIVQGETVTIEWEVEGADDVSISPLGSGLPLAQGVVQSPAETTNYVLNASNGSARIDPIARVVFVTPPSPTPTGTPEPDAPEIVLFAADKTELIQGKADASEDEKNVVLSWSTRGTVTNVELNGGPDIGIFSNLDPEGTLPVTISKNTVFVLTAFNQDKTASRTVQVEVVAATPTPVPTPTTPPPLPTPQCQSFNITAPGEPKVKKVQETNNCNKDYEVQINTEVTFGWQFDSAATGGSELTFGGQVVGSGTNQGSVPRTILASGNYRLVAKNADGNESSPAIINVTVVEQPPPNPPFNVRGTEGSAPNTNLIEWDWNPDPAKSDIIGFRVYRSDLPNGPFVQIGPSVINNPPGTQEYSDNTANPTCNRAYYVVAVYEDLSGNQLESAVSTSSWFSSPC
jgi:hypothetical protein